MDAIFANLPNDIIIKILVDRKEIKRDDRYKRQFDAVINDIKFVGTKKYKSSPWPSQSSILHKLHYEYQSEDNLLLCKAVRNAFDDNELLQIDRWLWDSVRHMSNDIVKEGSQCEEARLVGLWELEWSEVDLDDIPKDEILEYDFLHFVVNLYPEWGIRYLSQYKPDPWLPADAGFI